MQSYLLTFALALWSILFSTHHVSRYRQHEMALITADIASTSATPLEALTLENVVAMETGWERGVVGRQGEVGAFQIMSFPGTTKAQKREWKVRGAAEALRRMRTQGMLGYIGCRHLEDMGVAGSTCGQMISNRTLLAQLYLDAFPPPSSVYYIEEVAKRD
jgi:hypothetical protein